MSKNDSLACYSDRMENMSLNGRSIFEKRDYMGSNPAVARFFIHSGGEAGFKGVLYSFLPHSLAVIVAVVLVSRILHRLLRLFKQPLIVCQLITGILLFSFLPKDGKSNDVGIAMDPANRRINHVLGKIAVLLNLFILGVKFDFHVLQYKKKTLIIGFGSVLAPFAVGLVFALLKYKELGFQDKDQHELMFFTVYVLSSTYPMGIYEILSELDLVNSELGHMALSASIVQLFLGWFSMLAIIMVKQSQTRIFDGFLALISTSVVSTVAAVVIRSYSLWIVRTTGSHARVRDVHIWLITLSVFVTGLLADMIGFLSYADIAIITGLIIPTGPPLGTALIEQMDLVTSHVLLPIIFLHQGFYMDWTLVMEKISVMLWLGSLVLLTFMIKFVSIVALARYCKVPLKKGILLAFIMNFRGFLDMLYFLNLASVKIIHEITFNGMVLWNMPITAICSPVVAVYYKPILEATNQTTIRTVEERSETRGDLSVMACFFDDKPIPALLDFLETNNATCIYSLHLVESQGSALSNLIYHRNVDGVIGTLHMYPFHNHFISLETMETMGARVEPFTSISPLNSMIQDICTLVLNNNISFVIIPYPKRNSIANLEATTTMHALLPLVLERAPCTVGIMVYSGAPRIIGHSSGVYRVAVIFWGGPDDRETIAIASRMACHPRVELKVIRFRTCHSPSTTFQKDNDDDIHQKESDEQMITKLRAANKENNRVNISDIIVQNAEKVMSVMLEVDNEKYDLLIVGWRQKCLSIFGDKWVNWIESPELGVMGDLVSTGNSDMTDVLIVQQHMEGINPTNTIDKHNSVII